ncbi:MAG: cytochrome c peroxidase [Saprospiraceae bacterium]
MLIALVIGLTRCHDTIDMDTGKDLTHIAYQPVPYSPLIPPGFPALEQPGDNLMTIDGIRLGRKLFYDPILSIDSSISCSSCHQQFGSFTDQLAISPGVAGMTSRSSMSLINIGFHHQGLFWDGRAQTLEEQALIPVENSTEMGESWERVEDKLQNHSTYPSDFRKAFGIETSTMITKELAAKALAQFERSLISGGNTKYDRFARGEIFLDENEYNGFLMFFDFEPSVPDAECGHCHNAPLFATNDFFNNGLQESADFSGFTDNGLGIFTGKASDNGKFKAPTLRNIAFTAPYMHDGRFNTLEEVVEHYNSGGKASPNKNALLHPLHLTEGQKSDLIAFILTLTDSSTLVNEAFQSPF